MRTAFLLLTALLLLGAALPAQRLAAYMPGGPGFFEHQPPTPILPAPIPPLLGYPAVPPLPAVAALAGDSTFDNLTGLHWFTNGLILAGQPTPTFPPAGPIMPPMPFPAAVLAAIGGGPVTGIAIDPAAGVLFVTGAPGFVVGIAAAPAMPIVVPPFPIVGAAAPITGLEWDSITGSLLAVSAPGVTFNFAVGGAPLAPPLPPPIVLPVPAGDVAIDKTTRLNGAGLRPLYVVAGPLLLDVRDPAPLLFPSAMPAATGLAFLDHPAANPPIGACACPGLPGLGNRVNGPMASGNVGWAIGMAGLPPFGFGLFAFDAAFNPALPLVNVVGCGLGLFPGSPTLIVGLGIADAAGNAVFPLGLGLPPGVGPLYNQNATFCAADPTGFVFLPMQRIQVAGL